MTLEDLKEQLRNLKIEIEVSQECIDMLRAEKNPYEDLIEQYQANIRTQKIKFDMLVRANAELFI